MQLNQLEALLGVLEHGSFLAAARALSRRRGTLQAQVEALEDELGHQLLVRSARGAHPTRAGEAFAARARSLLADAEHLRGFLDGPPQLERLRLAVQPGAPPDLFVLMVQVLGVRLPSTRVELVICSPEEAVADPEVDLVAQFRDRLPPGGYRTFVYHRYPIRALASQAYLDARGRPQSVEDLSDHALLAWTGHRPERATSWPRSDGTTFTVSPAVVSNDTHALRTLANAGLGVALVADSPMVDGTGWGEKLVPVLDGVVGETGTGRILIPNRAANAPAVRSFVKLAREFGLEADETLKV